MSSHAAGGAAPAFVSVEPTSAALVLRATPPSPPPTRPPLPTPSALSACVRARSRLLPSPEVPSAAGTASVASTAGCDHLVTLLEGASSFPPPHVPPFTSPPALTLSATMSWSGGAGLPASDGTPDADVNKAAELLAAEGPPWSVGGGAAAAAAAPVPVTAVASRTALSVRRGSGVGKAPASLALARASSTAEVARAVFKKKIATSAGAASAAPQTRVPAKTPEEEKAAKYEARLVMNRKSAKASRIRRASYLGELEAAVADMESINAKLVAKLEAVVAENAQLRIDVAKARQEAPQAMVAAEAAVAASSGPIPTVEAEGASAALVAAAVPVPAVGVPPVEVAAFEASLHAMFPGMEEQDAVPLVGGDVDDIPPPDLDFLEDPFP